MEKSIHSPPYRTFVKVLRQERERAGLTQVQLAKKVRETQTFISKCERGERRVDFVELRAFCRAFGISLQEFTEAFERALHIERPRRRKASPIRQPTFS